jgi:hypothetical protein
MSHLMRTIRAVAFLTCLTTVAGAQKPGVVPPSQKIDRRFAAAPDLSLRFAGAFARLTIIGWDRDSVVLTGSASAGAQVGGGGSAPPAHSAKFYVEMSDLKANADGVFELRVPTKARIWAKAGTATITVTGVTGELDLNIVGGEIKVSGSPRTLNIESLDGNVSVDGAPAWLRVRTAAGQVELVGGSDDAGLTTVSGPIRVSGNGTIERGKFESVSGDIVFSSQPAKSGSLTFDTHSGRVELQLSPKIPIEFDGAAMAGTIENTLTKSRPGPGREGRGQELGFGGGEAGTARIVVRTFKGTVVLRPR